MFVASFFVITGTESFGTRGSVARGRKGGKGGKARKRGREGRKSGQGRREEGALEIRRDVLNAESRITAPRPRSGGQRMMGAWMAPAPAVVTPMLWGPVVSGTDCTVSKSTSDLL